VPDGAVTKASLLLEEYKILSEGLHKHQTFIYSVMPGMLTVLGALLAFTATKELPQSQIQWFWLAGAVAIALAYAWTAMSHSVSRLHGAHWQELQVGAGTVSSTADRAPGHACGRCRT
jgi:ABC-type spermidine/putrescine transport system permease subunit II